jgi:hypothetical protein
MIRKILFIVFVVIAGRGYAQDLIIELGGHRIFCEIIKEDSVSLSYIKTGDRLIYDIPKRDVERFYFNSKSRLAGKQRDSIVATDDYFVRRVTQTKREEILLFDINGGAAIPVGDFGKKDVQKPEAGIARIGLTGGVTATVKLAKFVGLSVAYNYQMNGVDEEAIKSSMMLYNPGVTFAVNATRWVATGFYGGLYFTFPVAAEERVSLDFNFKAGMPKFVIPELSITGSYRGNSATTWQREVETHALAFTGGMGIQYKASDQAALRVGISFLQAKPEFKNVTLLATGYPPQYFDATQLISTVNVQLGLVILIGSKKVQAKK